MQDVKNRDLLGRCSTNANNVVFLVDRTGQHGPHHGTLANNDNETKPPFLSPNEDCCFRSPHVAHFPPPSHPEPDRATDSPS